MESSFMRQEEMALLLRKAFIDGKVSGLTESFYSPIAHRQKLLEDLYLESERLEGQIHRTKSQRRE